MEQSLGDMLRKVTDKLSDIESRRKEAWAIGRPYKLYIPYTEDEKAHLDMLCCLAGVHPGRKIPAWSGPGYTYVPVTDKEYFAEVACGLQSGETI